MSNRKNREGLAMLLVLGFLAVIMTGSAAFYTLLNATLSLSHAREEIRTCLNLAEAGADKAIAELRRHPAEYQGERDVVLGKGRFSVEVTPMEGPRTYRVISKGSLRDGGFVRRQACVVAKIFLAADGHIASLQWSEGKP